MDILMAQLIMKIKKRRKMLGYTQADVARKCGIKQANYSRFESGHQLPTVDTLITILNALDLRLNITPSDDVHYTIMWRNRTVARVFLLENRKEIQYEKIEPDGIHQPFSGDKLDLDRFYRFIKSRCYEDDRGDLEVILKKANLQSNNPYDFIKISHGVTYSDDFWIKTSDELLLWEDVKIR